MIIINKTIMNIMMIVNIMIISILYFMYVYNPFKFVARDFFILVFKLL